MRAVLSRVKHASVSVDGKIIGQIGEGFLVLLGVTHEDTEAQAEKLADKLTGLRIFEDENEKMNRSLTDVGGQLLIVSQFTLYANCKKAIVSVILTPDKLFVFLTISTFALDGIVTTKLSPTFGVLLISPILITNLSLEAETIFACNFFLFSIIFYINVQTPTNEPACSGSRI